MYKNKMQEQLPLVDGRGINDSYSQSELQECLISKDTAP